MNKRKPISNGADNANILNEEQQEMRLKVVDAELKARYWKAQWEIRHYTLEAEALQGKYDEYVAAQMESQRKAFEAYLEQMKKENAAGPVDENGPVDNVETQALDVTPTGDVIEVSLKDMPKVDEVKIME